MTDRRPDPPPLEVDEVRVVAWGTALFALVATVLALGPATLTDGGREWWLWTCVWGTALGLVGLRHCVRRRAAIARAIADEASSHPA